MGSRHDELFAHLRAAVLEVTGKDLADHPGTTALADIDIDSLDVVETVVVLEERSELALDPSSLDGLNTVDDLIEALDRLDS